jgi:hypothetical protein
MNTGIVNIRGKEYMTVALRVQQFREKHPLWAIETHVEDRTEEYVVMRCEISNEEGRILATGHAEEFRKSSQINSTSALENAETSCIGRALAALGFGGSEFASANEVQNAVAQQAKPQARGNIDKALEAISKAESMIVLKTVYEAATRAFKDPEDLVKITEAKDKRKAELA